MSHEAGEKKSIQAMYMHASSARDQALETARLASALTKPWILPAVSQTKGKKLPENFQSVGSKGVTNLEGRMLLALWPPDQPWFALSLEPELMFGDSLSEEEKQEFLAELQLWTLMIQAKLGSTAVQHKKSRRLAEFRARKRAVLSQVLITGETLEQLTPDYRIKVYSRDQYVNKRNNSTEIVWHIIDEEIDVLTLSDEQFLKSGLESEIRQGRADERAVNMYTMVEWNPRSDNWKITQEVNENTIVERTEEVTPYFCTAYEVVPGDDYGRGFVELNIGDLRSLNALRGAELDFAAIAAKMTPVIDDGSNVEEEDLALPTGQPIRARVINGVVQDIAFLQTGKIADFKAVFEKANTLELTLRDAFLMLQARDSERTTKFEVQQNVAELEQGTGGAYASLADEQQVPMLRRTIWQMIDDGSLPELPKEIINVEALTGLAALARSISAQRIRELISSISQLPEAMQKLDQAVLVEVLARYLSIYEPGLLMSKEKIAEEQANQIAALAAQKGVDVAGDIISARATQQQPGA